MTMLSHMAMYPRLWTFGAVVLLMLVLLANLRLPLRVMLAAVVLLPALPVLLVRTAALQLVALCDKLVEGRPWTRPLAWAAREIDHHISQTQEEPR